MPRLVLFTGGIESTAMLYKSEPEDIALTIYDHDELDPLFDLEASKAITALFGRRHVFGHLSIGHKRHTSANVFQLYAMMAGASLWVSKDPSITEVWFGLNSAEPAPMWVEPVARMVNAWDMMHPTVRFISPLIQYSADEQWTMIPDNARPLVRNCLLGTDCGTCRKCVKLKKMQGSFWQVT